MFLYWINLLHKNDSLLKFASFRQILPIAHKKQLIIFLNIQTSMTEDNEIKKGSYEINRMCEDADIIIEHTFRVENSRQKFQSLLHLIICGVLTASIFQHSYGKIKTHFEYFPNFDIMWVTAFCHCTAYLGSSTICRKDDTSIIVAVFLQPISSTKEVYFIRFLEYITLFTK